jgi:hypothetical protein
MNLDIRHPVAVRGAIFMAAVAPLLALRLHQAQPGLLYPDGYQYLLMAKGVAAHGRLFLTLGPGGDTLLPNVDAAAKPLYPALVAAVHQFGVGWFDAARLVSALAAAATVVLAALLARRLTGSWPAAAVAAGGCVASRELAFWGGFAGPDSLGQAFALASTLALLGRRPRLGGALAALAVLARPELAVLAVVAAIVGITLPELRQAALRAGLSFVVVLAAVLALLRPPIGAPPLSPSLALVALALLTTVVCVIAKRTSAGGPAWLVVCGPLAVSVAVLLGQAAGTRRWVHDDWPLLLAGSVGCVLGLLKGRLRPAAGALLVSGAALALVYWSKNPGSERYLALLTPLVAVLAGFAVAVPRRTGRVASVVVVALLLVTGLVRGVPEPGGSDTFPTVARQLRALDLPAFPVVTVAPDAYGVLLSDRAVRLARPGVKGLVLLDGAQRAYSPDLRVAGRVVASLEPGPGFLRPDGTVDRRAVTVVLGTVVAS